MDVTSFDDRDLTPAGCVFVRGIPKAISGNDPATRCIVLDSLNWEPTIRGLKQRFLGGTGDRDNSDILNLYHVLSGGKVQLDESCSLDVGKEYTLQCRVRGGKGGYGSLLRSVGSQIRENPNQDACRDLSGRRMRNVNAQKNIRELAGRQVEKKKQKEAVREEKLKKLKSQLESKPEHNFNNAEYEAERRSIPENVYSAIEEGMTMISSWKTEIVMKDGVETKTETAATETYLSEKPSTSATVLPEPTSRLSSSKKRQHVDPLDKDPKHMKRWFD